MNDTVEPEIEQTELADASMVKATVRPDVAVIGGAAHLRSGRRYRRERDGLVALAHVEGNRGRRAAVGILDDVFERIVSRKPGGWRVTEAAVGIERDGAARRGGRGRADRGLLSPGGRAIAEDRRAV